VFRPAVKLAAQLPGFIEKRGSLSVASCEDRFKGRSLVIVIVEDYPLVPELF
jgi:hypothetical protein